VHVPPLEGPVTIVVLDEFPLSAIVRPDGTINEVRYPNLAALAEQTTWFRNAATESVHTATSTPSILTGRLPKTDALPILTDHPRNYFTLFGRSYPVHRYERVTDLCPPDACGRPPAQPLAQALDDARLVYQHRVLPAQWRERLPAVDQSWGQFDDEVGGGAIDAALPASPEERPGGHERLAEVSEEDRSKRGQLNALVRQARLIGASPSVNFIHVLSPHHPYVLTPWGTVSIDTLNPKDMPPAGTPGSERIFAERYTLQAMQVGALDQAIGEMVEHWKQTGAWETGTFVITSDHGTTTSMPGSGRTPTDETQDDVLRIPLFFKAPGQTVGEVRDDPASTIDVLPSIVDVLDIETNWAFDGHSLFDGSEPTADRWLTSELPDLYDHVARQQAAYPHGEDWAALAAIGEFGDLVGTSVSQHEIGAASQLTWSLDDRDALDDPSSTDGRVPVLVTGTLSGGDREPPELVVAIDGEIAGTIGVGEWRPEEDGERVFTGILGPPGARGEGEEVVAYEVERADEGIVLRPVAES
jgi:hypothetical protein